MSIKSRKAGSQFGGISTGNTGPELFAQLIVKACRQLGMTPTAKLVSEGLGTIDAEGGFTKTSWTSNPYHLGPWALGSSYGSAAERLDPWKSTLLAIEDRKKNGSFWNSWWQWEEKQGEVETGQDRAPKFLKLAEKAGAGGSNPSLGEEIPGIGGAVGAVEGAVGGVIGGVTSAEEFLQNLAETLLDFRRLGQLAAEAFSWMLRLLAKAIWDYVIAPLFHWGERAVSFYWINFFDTGTEQGSGFGYQLRNNAGTITILFWSIGYSVLWSDGTSVAPVAANETMLGQGVKSVDKFIARRNLIKPKDVKKKTPAKPKPTVSRVPIQKKQTYRVGRNRPVRVESHTEGRQRVGSRGQQQFNPAPVERPQEKTPAQTQGESQSQTQNQPAAQPGRPRVDSRPRRRGGA